MARRAGVIAGVFAVAFLAWVHLFSLLGTTGIAGRVLQRSDRFCPNQEVARVAFKYRDVPAIDFMVAGDKRFLKQMSRYLGGSRNGVYLRLLPSPLWYGQAISVFAEKRPKYVILQNAPHNWTDTKDRVTRLPQEIDLWTLYRNPEISALPLAQAIIVVRKLIDWSQIRCKDKAKDFRPDRYLFASFMPPELIANEIAAYDAESRLLPAEVQVLWVFDPSWIPDDAMEDTRAALLAFATGPREVEGLGMFVSIHDLDSVFKK